MLSDEEKQAIEKLDWYFEDSTGLDIEKQIRIILNLIEKQSKEIEELKDTRSIFNMGRRSYKNEIENKIKAKIEYYKKIDNAVGVRILESLLEKE